MSIQSDLTTALAAVASGRVYPQAAPQDAALPFVVYQRVAFEPLMTLQGPADNAKSTFRFECWATTLAGALALAAAVLAAIAASATPAVAAGWREASEGDEYEPVVDQFVEFVTLSFWHT